MATGTSFEDTYLCRVASAHQEVHGRHLPVATASVTETTASSTYSAASSTGAAAGNRYEESVYAIAGSNPCTAVRYYIHYAAIENFEPGVVREFDRATLLAAFDTIRASLLLGTPAPAATVTP